VPRSSPASLRRIFAAFCILAGFSCPCTRAQSPGAAPQPAQATASQPPYDRLELLATLRAYESKPYLIEKIRTRGVDFTPDAAFLQAVAAPIRTPDVLQAIAESKRPGSPESPDRRKAYLILTGVGLLRLTPAGREQYEAALALAPDSAALHMIYGGAFLLIADFRDAETQERTSLELWPGDADAHVALLLALAGQERDDEAITEAREALRIYPNHKVALMELGMELTRDRQFKEAVPVLREAIARAPEISVLHKHLGLSLFNTGDIEGAVAEDALYLQANPNDSEGHYDLGVALRAQGHPDDAQAQFREAARLDPSNPLFGALANPSAAQNGPEGAGGQRPDDASVDGNIYTNKFFQFSLQFPEDWTVMSADAQKNVAKLGGEMLAGRDQFFLDAHQAFAAHSYPLFFVTAGKSGDRSYSTRSIQISALDPTVTTGITSAADFLTSSAKIAQQLQTPVQSVGPPVGMTVGGRLLWRMDMTMRINDSLSYFTEIVTIERGYLLLFVLSSPDQQGLDEILHSMSTLRFIQNSN